MIHNEGTHEDRPVDELPRDEIAERDDQEELDDDLDDLDGPDDDDTALEPDSLRAPGDGEETNRASDDVTSGPDDALGLYLRQMGSIPLLTRDKELALA